MAAVAAADVDDFARPAEVGELVVVAVEAAREVVRVAEAVLRGLSARDTAALRPLLLPEVSLTSVANPARPRGPVSIQDASTFFRTLPNGSDALRERMWSPSVALYGGIAMVHTPYDFHVNGKFSHCGTDVFTLVKSPGGRWRVAQVAYTVHPTGCAPSPLGPPT